jgi:E3 ubiquitin-protein ligase HUWE1
VIATWVHNEPSSLAIIQESKLPESFYGTIEAGIEPMIEVRFSSFIYQFLTVCQVIHGMLNAMGALSLNQAGQTLLQARSNVIPTFFGIFTSELHVTPLQEKSNASLIGGDVDELVRHHPWLRTFIFKGIVDVLDKIEVMAKAYQPKAGTEGHFNLVPTDRQRPESEDTIMAEPDEPAPEAKITGKADANPLQSFDLHEMPLYQHLNNFFKVSQIYHIRVWSLIAKCIPVLDGVFQSCTTLPRDLDGN